MVTLFALFGYDVKHIVRVDTPGQLSIIDNIFDSVTVFCMLIYSVEIFLQCQADSEGDTQEDPNSPFYWKYKFSMYFWLDITSTALMALDIAWLLQVLFPINLNQPKTLQKKITIIT